MNIDKRLCHLADSIPCGKLLLAVISFLPFWAVFEVKVAILTYGCIVLHEVGHAFGARLRKVNVKGIYMLPRFNAKCTHKKTRNDWITQLIISIMGPLFDFIVSSTIFVLGMQSDNKILLFSSFIICFRMIKDLVPQGKNDGRKIWEIIKKPFRVSLIPFWKRRIAMVVYISILLFSVFVFASIMPLLTVQELHQIILYRILILVFRDRFLGRLV